MATNNSINAPIPFSVANGGTGATTLTANGVLLGNTTGAIAATAAFSANGQLLIGNGSSAPAVATLTAGTGIQITNGAGSIAINATAGGLTWNSTGGTSDTLAPNNGYIANSALLTTYTLPTTATVGQQFVVMSSVTNVGCVKISPGTVLQTIRWGNAATLVTQSLQGSAIGDAITLVCVSAATPGSEVFQAINMIGNFA